MNYITTNIFCIIANAGSEQELYLKYLLSDIDFVEDANLTMLIYNTTKPKYSHKSDILDKYNYIDYEEFTKIPEDSIIDSRSYYTIPYDTIYYFTLEKDIKKEKNLICIATPYQYENYKRWISIENIKQPNHYSIHAILIHCTLKERFSNKILTAENDNDEELLEFCRRVLSDNAEFRDAKERIPELNDPMNSDNVCYVNCEKSENGIFNDNISQIKGFILDKVKFNQF